MSDAEMTEVPATQETSFGRWLVETVILVALAFALAQGIKAFLIQPFVIPTGSMIPTIEIGDRVLAEKVTYRWMREPRRGEIVVFDDPAGDRPQLIKRVIATGGQVVELKDGRVVVDGEALEEPYTYGKPSQPLEPGVTYPYTVPEGSVWVMGDNRTNSGDSRVFGAQPLTAVRGRAFWTYWPPNRFGDLD